jgi:thymidylate kinase
MRAALLSSARGLLLVSATRVRASAAMSAPRGAFIVLEGTDRSGKSTQVARLVASLNARGVRAEAWRFPDRTSGCGRMIDAYLRAQPGSELDDGAVHLLFSANRWEKRRVCGWLHRALHSSLHCLTLARATQSAAAADA